MSSFGTSLTKSRSVGMSAAGMNPDVPTDDACASDCPYIISLMRNESDAADGSSLTPYDREHSPTICACPILRSSSSARRVALRAPTSG